MQKLDYSFGNKSVPNVWQPCHALEIYNFLKKREYNLSVYKCLDSSKYIVANGRSFMFFKNAAAFCEYFEELYFKERALEEQEILKHLHDHQQKIAYLEMMICNDLRLSNKER